jgi:predicted unusual protein kinase regulating ubiquinone biosynthesis (AarF/ABC1/UbiB family)
VLISQLIRSVYIFGVFFAMLADYLWMDFLERFRSDESRTRAEARAYGRWGRRLRKAALRLHGVIIKVCQFLSTRADVLPESFTRELASLQDAVPAAPYPAIRRRVESELGAPLETIFAEFETEALASASLGQVHRAKLKEGQTVAVKVLRPGIERLVDVDMAAVRRIWMWLGRHTSLGRKLDMKAVVDEFEVITRQEMDYRLEAENIRKFRKNFAGVPGIDVPYPFDNLVAQRLLVMEFKSGMKLTERDRLHAAGVDTKQLASRLVDAYLKQVLLDGFIHVDPHPGNLMVEPDGTLIFVDFGMMGVITAEDRQGFTLLVRGLLTRDMDLAVKALAGLGFLRKDVSTEPLKRALIFLLDHVSGLKIQPGPELDKFVQDFREWLYEEPLQFPARYIYIGRAVGLLVGIGNTLDPNLDWVKILKDQALPLLEQSRRSEAKDEGAGGFDWRRLAADLFGPAAGPAVDAVWTTVKDTGMSLIRLPGQLERSLAKLENGSVQVQTDLSGLSERLDMQARLMNRLTWAVLAAGTAVVGSLLQNAGQAGEARIAWGGCGLAVLLLLGNLALGNARRRRRSPHRRRS